MEQTMPVLARQIANLTDARYFAAKEVQGLVFNLEAGTEGYLDPIQMQAMREWVEGPAILGEFGSQTPAADVREASSFFRLDGVVVPISFDLSSLDGLTVFVKIALDTPGLEALMLERAALVKGWILELPGYSGSWIPALSDLQPLAALHSLYLHYHGPSEELKEVLDTVRPAGITLSGGEEEAVGLKSFDAIEELFDVLEQELG